MLQLLTVRVANHADYMNNRCTACREGAETVTVIYQGGDREMELRARQGERTHADPMPFRLPPARGTATGRNERDAVARTDGL
jgi:hypothetical protein